MKKFTNPCKLASTEKNKTKICEAVKEKWLDGYEIAKLIGISYSRVSVLAKVLGEDGFIEYKEELTMHTNGGRKRRYFHTIKPYVEKKIELKEQGKYYRPNNYYGAGEFFNPFAPKIPEGGTPRKIELFDEKDNSYFSQPLRKLKSNGIGSTFSIYQDYAL